MTRNTIRAALVAAAGAAVMLAVPAHADTSDTATYKEICKMLDGASPNSVANRLQNTYGTTLDTARLTIMVAIDAYCPSHQVPPDWKDWTGR